MSWSARLAAWVWVLRRSICSVWSWFVGVSGLPWGVSLKVCLQVALLSALDWGVLREFANLEKAVWWGGDLGVSSDTFWDEGICSCCSYLSSDSLRRLDSWRAWSYRK